MVICMVKAFSSMIPRNTRADFLKVSVMDREGKYTKVVPSTKAIGLLASDMVRGGWLVPMDLSKKASGSVENLKKKNNGFRIFRRGEKSYLI